MSETLIIRDVRHDYRMWGPHQAASNTGQSLIILDWDDTLQPTSWMVTKGLLSESGAILSTGTLEVFDKICTSVIVLLEFARTLGRVMIITNSGDKWVDDCVEKFMPRLKPELKGVDVMSARHFYEQFYINRPEMWKVKAFNMQVYSTFGASTSVQRNVISIGDGLHERMALMSIKGINTYAKSVKLVAAPTPAMLIKQIDFIGNFLKGIVAHKGDLDLAIDTLPNLKENISPVEPSGNPAEAKVF